MSSNINTSTRVSDLLAERYQTLVDQAEAYSDHLYEKHVRRNVSPAFRLLACAAITALVIEAEKVVMTPASDIPHHLFRAGAGLLVGGAIEAAAIEILRPKSALKAVIKGDNPRARHVARERAAKATVNESVLPKERQPAATHPVGRAPG